jgi:hypothetical protein
MSENEIKSALASLHPTHPFWQGVQSVLRDAVENEVNAVTNPGLTDSARQFNAGRLAHARDIQNALAALVNESSAPRA